MTFSTFASPGVSLQGGGGSGGGGGTPGGSNTQIQYNNSGAFAGASGLTTNGTELTIASGTKTADAPVLDMSQTWNSGAVTFTGLKFNATDTASASGSLLINLQVGGSSRFRVQKDGSVTASGSLNVGANIFMSTNAAQLIMGAGNDVRLIRKGAANFQLGAADAAAPVAQTLSVQSVVAGTTNTAGANLTITGSQGTGTGAGGSIIFQVAPAGSSGTAQNALATTAQFGPFQGKLYLGSASPAISNYAIWGDGTNTWVNAPTSGGYVHFGSLDNWGVAVHPASVRISSTFTLGWTASNPGAALDLILARDAANTLAQRNGANAQAFRVYNTTDGTNSEFGGIRWAANVFTIGPQTAGTGTARATSFVDGTGTERIGINASNGVVNVASMQLITSSSISYIGADTAGFTLRYASGSNTDMMVRFAGITSSFPALKRSSASLIVRLADDTANAALESASLKTDAPTGGTAATWKLGTVASVTPTLQNRTIEVDIGGTIYYISAKTTND